MFRLLELCAGYGSQALALKNLGIDVYSEIAEFDKYASKAYMQIHGETKNYGDIYSIDETKLPYFDMITYSTPCQDFSVAGKGKGGDKGSGTRSSLLWECERIIRAVRPKYLLFENVKNILSDKHRHNFNEWFKVLESMGYKNYYKVLNAEDYGIPQNRERIFCVSILGGGQFLFPNPVPLEKFLFDMLEDEVDEKYFLSDKMIKLFIKKEEKGWKFKPKNENDKIANCITSRYSKMGVTDNYIVVPLKIKEATKKGYAEAYEYDSVSLDQPNSKTRRGRVGKQIANTLTCSCNIGVVVKDRIRRLTPHECWRLMGVTDEQYDRLQGLSDTQLYKLAGNSIVVDVLEAIFRNLLMPETTDTKGQLSLF